MSRQPLLLNGETCFITFTTTAWIDLFTKPELKHIIIDSIRYCQKHKGLNLYAWCLMTNHIHMIASADEGVAINDVIRDMKKFTSHKISKALNNGHDSRKEWILNLMKYVGRCHPKDIEYKVWKDGFDCFEIFQAKTFDQKLDYIHNNPVRAEIVEEPHHYLYSSARNYADMQGLLDVIVV
jgi:REP element-mobilizing transposase RayT